MHARFHHVLSFGIIWGLSKNSFCINKIIAEVIKLNNFRREDKLGLNAQKNTSVISVNTAQRDGKAETVK